MNVRPRSVVAELITPQIPEPCAVCAVYDFGICRAASLACALKPGEPFEFEKSSHTVPARRVIFREHEYTETVPVICEGWAASNVMLSDGTRQILSFLLPGDLVSAALLFDAKAHCSVEAITDVRYRTFDRATLKATLLKKPDLLDKLFRAWVEEKTRSDQLIVDLGRRTAEERIARLILSLKDRLALRGMVRSEPMEMDFPLRQHHIADAIGLTPVHVSKVLSEFRRAGILKISDRSLTILDHARFVRIALMR